MSLQVVTCGDDGTVLQNTLKLPADTTIGGSAVVALGTITATNANAFTVGRQGTTNPAFNVNTAASSGVTGLLVTAGNAAAGLALAVTSSGTNENLTLDAKGSGTILLNGTATGAVLVGDATNPALSVVHTTEGTGLKVTSAAAASGVAIAAISSGTDESMTLNAKGAGSVTINGVATGPTIIPVLRGTPEFTTITGDGAVTIQSGSVLLTKGSAAAITVAAPGAGGIGTRITITGGTDFAHIVTFTGGTLWDGTAGANTTWTTTAVQGCSLTVLAVSATKWNVESFNLGTIAP